MCMAREELDSGVPSGGCMNVSRLAPARLSVRGQAACRASALVGLQIGQRRLDQKVRMRKIEVRLALSRRCPSLPRSPSSDAEFVLRDPCNRGGRSRGEGEVGRNPSHMSSQNTTIVKILRKVLLLLKTACTFCTLIRHSHRFLKLGKVVR